MADKLIFTVFGGFIAGVFLRSFLNFGVALPLFLILLSVSLILWSRFAVLKSEDVKIFLIVAFFSLAAAFGAVRFELSLDTVDPNLSARVGKIVTVLGSVSGEPDVREAGVFLEVEFTEIIEGEDRETVFGKARVSVDFAPEVLYGDALKLSGKLSVPENFETDGGRVFDYRAYLLKDNIRFEMYRPEVEIISTGGGSVFKRTLFKIKSGFIKKTAELIKEPEHSLLAGLLLGAKHGLGQNLTDDFRRAGLVHIIVLSGFNMTIVAFAIRWFLEHIKLPRMGASVGGIIGIIIFVVMVGGGATAVRAAIMAVLGIVADLVGRGYRINRALFAAAFVMIMHNPQIVAFDPSFQLSFMATLGLIHLSPVIESKLGFVSKFFGIREIVAATISTQIFVLPLLISMSGEVSIVSIVANILVLPFIPVTMFVGFVTGVTAFVSGLLAAPFAYVSIVLLKYEILVAGFFGSLPFAALQVPGFLTAIVLFSYVFLLGWLFVRQRKLATVDLTLKANSAKI